MNHPIEWQKTSYGEWIPGSAYAAPVAVPEPVPAPCIITYGLGRDGELQCYNMTLAEAQQYVDQDQRFYVLKVRLTQGQPQTVNN